MFLESGEPQRVLAKQLQYLLLLALRIGVLVLVALAFAGLAWERPGATSEEESGAFHLIVIDTSLSMAHGDRWARARAEARSIIGRLGTADFAQLVSAGRLTEIVAESSSGRDTVIQALNLLEPSLFRIDYGELMDAVDGFLRGVELPIILHVITDTQETALPTRFADLAPHVPLELQIYNVAVPDEYNWSVDGLAYLPESGDLSVSVRGSATEPTQKQLVLELNGDQIAEQQIAIEGDGFAKATFRGINLAVGPNRVHVRVDAKDELEVDDQRFLVLNRPVPLPVLLISNDPRGHDVLFLASALETLVSQPFQVEHARPLSVVDHELSLYAFAIVTDAGSLGVGETELLADYVEAGGSVLMALTQSTMGLDKVPLSGHQLQVFSQLSGIAGAAFTVVGAMDRSHPALQAVDELRGAKFFRYIGIDPQPDDQVLIQLNNGSPLLVEHSRGNGRVLRRTVAQDCVWVAPDLLRQ